MTASSAHHTGPVTLACPECGHVPLEASDAVLGCQACGRSWRQDSGLPLLLREKRDTYLADELTPEAAASLVASAEEVGWRAALPAVLRRLPAAQASYLEEYVCATSRALLTELLDAGEGDAVLDHGCGWGALTCELARRVRTVAAMDLLPPRARFTAIRARQEGLANVTTLASGDYRRLPFPDASFDAVVVNGVLEWVPTTIPGNPTKVQTQRLSEVARVLRPGGRLLLAIENRYWWRYFLGRPEVHTWVRGAAIVPRALADLLARRKGHRCTTAPFATCPHSHRRQTVACRPSIATDEYACRCRYPGKLAWA